VVEPRIVIPVVVGSSPIIHPISIFSFLTLTLFFLDALNWVFCVSVFRFFVFYIKSKNAPRKNDVG
ncbi:MAG: hypothetical protein ACTIJ4_14800, partial [Halomonas sp.]|uniref:hypothetical protein n=1 Tax=Halomonas sp. TaxID=1486246 RepID=UPI003F965A86